LEAYNVYNPKNIKDRHLLLHKIWKWWMMSKVLYMIILIHQIFKFLNVCFMLINLLLNINLNNFVTKLRVIIWKIDGKEFYF
jgi:hypothetical protein